MMLDASGIAALKKLNIDIVGQGRNISPQSTFEPPCALKRAQAEGLVNIGAFSYAVSGYMAFVDVGRYCSFAEEVQIGRQDHPIDWLSTSPFFYMTTSQVVSLEDSSEARKLNYIPNSNLPAPTKPNYTKIGNDVWIGHGAYVKAGVTIGDGAIVAAMSVVTKDVSPYAVVAGNPATVKKYRIPKELIAPILNTKWWSYAPWQLNQLSVHDIPRFLEEFSKIEKLEKPYMPTKISIIDTMA